jgi:putative ABC transport system ATP-binding protein
MIQISELKFSYPEGGFHLDIDALSIQRGETVAVIGPSGTGKTTLLNLISGVAVPHSGSITTNGVQISTLDDRARRDFRIQHIGFIFQEFELLEYLSVLDNILLPYRISGALKLSAAVRQRAGELADRVGLADKLGRNVLHLSQGERQRVAIARALLPDPALILADEPTGNLDPENTDRVLDIINTYVESNGATLVSVTHERHLLERFERVIDFSEFRKAGAHA